MEFFDNKQYETLEIETTNQWLLIKLNRPKNKNALSSKMIAELIHLMKLASSHKLLRGIILSGNGGSFCSGADLKEFKNLFSNGKPDRNQVIFSSLNVAKLLQSFFYFPKYIISCIDGAAYAGGFGLACCSDFIFATKNSKFGITEIKIGLTPAQITPFVINRLGRRNAKKLMLSGKVIDASRAAKMGLLDGVFDNKEEMFFYVKNFSYRLKSCAPMLLQ